MPSENSKNPLGVPRAHWNFQRPPASSNNPLEVPKALKSTRLLEVLYPSETQEAVRLLDATTPRFTNGLEVLKPVKVLQFLSLLSL